MRTYIDRLVSPGRRTRGARFGARAAAPRRARATFVALDTRTALAH